MKLETSENGAKYSAILESRQPGVIFAVRAVREVDTLVFQKNLIF
jgi:hypothetical protein